LIQGLELTFKQQIFLRYKAQLEKTISRFNANGASALYYDNVAAIRHNRHRHRRYWHSHNGWADGNGDISFYEDTGTTPKFFWDASAESLK
jgi:hypothetical protein